MNSSDFHFGALPDGDPGVLVHVPAGVDTAEALHALYQDALALPAWYGHNWDALYDCLTGLEHIDGRVTIAHEALPGLEPDALAVYLEVLADACVSWQGDGPPRLEVWFPADARERIDGALAG